MEYRYLYIDDDDKLTVGGTVNGLSEKGNLMIDHYQPTGSWETQLDVFLSTSFKDKYQGLLLDLRLEDCVNEQQYTAKYKGTSLAQELRTLMKEKKLPEIPIILLSAEQKLKQSFDLTGMDLFDIILPKEDLNHASFVNFRSKLVGLALGYEEIRNYLSSKDIDLISNMLGKDMDSIDIRFTTKLKSVLPQPIHQIASFLIKQFIKRNGLLISESILAARLGVDSENSADWKNLLNHLSDFSYKGVFRYGWNRWWMHEIDIWWTKTHGSKLRQLSAIDRVNALIESTKLKDLKVAVIPDLARSSKFWTICKGNSNPIDTIDGLLIANQDHLYPWQDREYVSYFEAINRNNVDKWKDVSPLEKDKLEQIKTINSRERVRRSQSTDSK